MTTAVLASISGQKLTDEEIAVLEKLQPAGVSLFARNIKDKRQLRLLTDSIKKILGQNAIIAVDQEGGRVRRLSEPVWPAYASQYVLGNLPVEVSKMHAALIARDLHEVGINFNYAPVLDTAYKYTHEVLRSRCFSKRVAAHGLAMAKAYIRNGICPCIKHIPGHGRVQTDPHLGLPIIKGSKSAFERDIKPFIANNQIPAGMTAHIVLPEIDDKPITMSKKAINTVIRKKIGFDGLLISDAIEMGALSGSIAERTEKALAAGCDLVCYCRGKIEELHELAELNPLLKSESLRRLFAVQNIFGRGQVDNPDYGEYMRYVGTVAAYKDKYDATEVLNLMNS